MNDEEIIYRRVSEADAAQWEPSEKITAHETVDFAHMPGGEAVWAHYNHTRREYLVADRQEATPVATKPPLGMVIYLPTHNHQLEQVCEKGCPYHDWHEHIARHGSPYPAPKPEDTIEGEA